MPVPRAGGSGLENSPRVGAHDASAFERLPEDRMIFDEKGIVPHFDRKVHVAYLP